MKETKIELNAIDRAVNSYLLGINVGYNCAYLGERKGWNGTKHVNDKFCIAFTKEEEQQEFTFRQGVGFRVKATRYDLDNARIVGRGYSVIDSWGREVVLYPTAASVLYCLISEAEFGRMSFDEFCNTLGYSNDSISAFNSYQECSKTDKLLRSIFNNQEIKDLQELLQDY